ncbi:MAG: NAD-dependent epimerase/dehydratase, partial [Sphingomonas bacterium]|nr:NAD-dependent epimerase/dehydratase [Sphingomonas bacterium]
TIVRPSVLAGDRTERRVGERAWVVALRLLAPLVPHRLRISPARAVAATLLDGAVAGPPGVHFKYNEDMV